MGAYKLDVVVVIKMGACIHGVVILCGCLLNRSYHISDIEGREKVKRGLIESMCPHTLN